MSRRKSHKQTLGVYRRCIDGDFKRHASEFLDENEDRIFKRASRVQKGFGLTLFDTKTFDKIAQRTKQELSKLSEIAQQQKFEDDRISKQIGGIALRLNPNAVYSVANRLEDALSNYGSMTIRVTEPRSLNQRIKNHRNAKNSVFYGFMVESRRDIGQLKEERNLIIGETALKLLGEEIDIGYEPGPIGDEHITLTRTSAKNAYELTNRWKQRNARPRYVTLGPPEVVVYDNIDDRQLAA